MLNTKKFFVTFVSLVLSIVLLMSNVMMVQAGTYPGVDPYPAHPNKLLAVVGNFPEWGYYGGYFAMWDRIMPSLSSVLGFSSAIGGNYYAMSDDWSFWDVIWDEPGWQYSTQDVSGTAPGGWDLTAIEWWCMPTGMLWNDAIILSAMTPPTGFNIFPYLNDRSDELYWKYQGAFTAADRKYWIDQWQLELLRNPPAVNVYSPYTYELISTYVEHYYRTSWWYDIDDMRINYTKVDELHDAEYISDVEYGRIKAGTLKYGVTEDWWNFNPLFVATYTEETMANIISHTLYSLSLKEWPEPGEAADLTKCYIKPDLAAGPAIFSGDGMVATIPLKTGITWSDGVPFNASDVKYTLDLNLIGPAKAVARGDFAPIVNEVNIVNEYTIELVLHRPYADLETILSNSWGLAIRPWHYYKDISPSALRGHETNWDWTVAKDVPVIGPYKLEAATTAYLRFVKNDNWWGPSYGYTLHDTVNEIWLVKVEDAATRFAQLTTHELDFGEYPTSPVGDFEALIGRPDLGVFLAPYVATNPVWFNFNNPYLSNRYVRLAIAYAIPYDTIASEVLGGWGVKDWVKGGTLLHPWFYYTDAANTTVSLYNDAAATYDLNPTLAQAYLDMWKLSRVAHAPKAGGEWVNGPVGDADFNGIVELDDFLLWIENLGNTEAEHAFLPGNDEDADFDNSNFVDLDDYLRWNEHIGTEYPPVPHDY